MEKDQMNIVKASDLKMEVGKPIVLAIPPCMNVSSALGYYNEDSTIAVSLECVRTYDQGIAVYRNMLDHCSGNDKYGVLMISTGDVGIISNIGKAVGYTYMLVPAGWDASRVNVPENVTLLTTTGADMRAVIQEMWDYVRFPVFTDIVQIEKLKLHAAAAACNIIRTNCRTPVTVCFDHHGRIVIRSVDPVINFGDVESKENFAINAGISLRETEYAAYVGVDYVTLSKDDARAIADLLDQVVEERGGDDVKAFGDKGISYERLHDRLTGLLYDSSTNTNSKKEEHDNA